MSKHKYLTDLISDVPELPEDLYQHIHRKITVTHNLKRMLFAVAAVLLISLVPFTMTRFTSGTTEISENLQPDIRSELELVSAYLNAEDLEDFNAIYTVVDNY